MSDELFPQQYFDYGYSEGPAYQTTLIHTFGMHEHANQDLVNPLWHFHLPLSLVGETQRWVYIDFFMRHAGRFDDFLFRSPLSDELDSPGERIYRVRFKDDITPTIHQAHRYNKLPDLELVERRVPVTA